MDIQQILVLRGPNVWANFPVLEVWVRLSKQLDVPSNTFPGFNDRLMSWLPSMIEHRCGIGERGGFFQRLRTGTYLGHILEHTSLEIQSLVGPAVGFGRARESILPGLYRVAIEYADERLGRACVETAIRLLDAAREGTAFSIDAELARLRAYGEQVCLGPSTQAIVTEAKARKVPVIRLNDGNLMQLGYSSAQHRIWTAESDQTGAVAEAIAQDKELTRVMLAGVGVPVPEGRAVSSADEAWDVAQDLGLPVVVKPREGNWGRSVSIRLTTREQIARAFEFASAEDAGVVVERSITGSHYRLLVVGNRVVAAATGEPDQVTGDGVHSIAELVELANANPERGDPQTHPLSRLELDAIANELLAQQGYTQTSIPEAGSVVVLHFNGDPTEDVTQLVHPSTIRIAVLAAKTIGLNIAGVDIVAEDISRPLDEQRGTVLEVNASPGLLMHLRPLRGEPQPVGAAIVEEILGSNQTGRIPIVAVSGTNGKSSVVALLEACFEGQGKRLGVACSDGLFVEGRALARDDGTSFESVERLLVNPGVDAILAEMDPRTVLTQGIAFDQCEVAVVTNIGSSDHLGYVAMDRDRMVLVERCGVDMVLPTGTAVLNADDISVLGMAPKCQGKVLLFSLDHLNAALVAHRAAGERTVAMRARRIIFSQGNQRIHESVWDGSLTRFEWENVLAALGAGWALGFEPGRMLSRLASACLSPRVRRLRWFEREGRRLAVSTCRNPSAFEAVFRALNESVAGPIGPNPRRTAICTHIVPDWRAQDAQSLGMLLGAAFDRVELLGGDSAESCPGGFADAPESTQAAAVRVALADGVASAHRASLVESDASPQTRIDAVLGQLAPGDLLFVQVGCLEGNLARSSIEEFLRSDVGSSTLTDAANLTRPLAET